MDLEQLEISWSLYLEGEPLDENRSAELTQALQADPQLRQRFLDQRALHGELCQQGRSTAMEQDFIEGLRDCLAEEKTASGFVRRLSAHLPKRQASWRPFALAAILAAAFLVGVVLLARPQRDFPLVTEAIGSVRILRAGSSADLSVGAAVESDGILITESGSRVRLRYRDGTAVAIGEESSVRLHFEGKAKAVQLTSGSLDADIAPQRSDRPMLFRSNDAIATVVGTRLSFIASATSTRLIVHEGTVRFARADADPIVVVGGQYAVAETGRPLMAAASTPLPAFPGAEGFGCETPGGRGGRVVEVTTLADDGPGSLRAACLMSEPRTIVFAVGGTIELKSRIVMRREQSFVTIAGQTAPGDGVQLQRWGILLSDGIHDAVIRYLRIRPGEPDKPDPSQGGFMVRSENGEICSRIVIDHCSLYWGPGATTGCANHVEDVTWQWCIVEGMAHDLPGQPEARGFGMSISTEEGKGASLRNITVHHCYLVDSPIGNPAIGAVGPVHVINNLVFNYGSFGTSIHDRNAPTAINLIGNRYVRGPSSSSARYAVGIDDLALADGFLYVRDNLGPFREQPSAPDWAIVGAGVAGDGYWITPAPKKFQRAIPWPDSPIPVSVSPCDNVAKQVLAGAGARLPKLDELDRRTLDDFQTGGGRIVSGSQQTNDWWPRLSGAPAAADRDHDGMPDAWESSRGLDADNPSDAATDRDHDGYSNLEDYLDSLSR